MQNGAYRLGMQQEHTCDSDRSQQNGAYTQLLQEHTCDSDRSQQNDAARAILNASPANLSCDIVQFSDAIYYALEGTDNELEIDIIRLGQHVGSSVVSFQTEDASAKAGVKYEAINDTISFEPGETVKTIRVSITNDSIWDSTEEFKVRLSNPSGCELGRYLHTCRVKIMDDDTFPTNYYQNEVLQGNTHSIPGVGLLLQYCRRNLYVRGVALKALASLVIDQLHNLYFLLITYVSIYMVDVVFSSEEEAKEELWIKDSRHSTLMIIAALYVVPFLLLNLADVLKIQMDLAGSSRQFLQQSLFQKYLNYDDDFRLRVAPTTMALAIIKEAVEVVEKGFMKSLSLVRIFGKLAVLAFFVHQEQPGAMLPIFSYPALMILCVWFRMHEYIRLGESVLKKETQVAHLVQETGRCFQLVSDYHQRPKMNDRFAVKIEEYGGVRIPLQSATLYNRYVFPWLSTLFIGCYIVFVSVDVLEGRLSLGTFLAMIKVFTELGAEFSEAFMEIMELAHAIGPLENLTMYLNGSTDLPRKRQLSSNRRNEMKKQRQEHDRKTLNKEEMLKTSLRARRTSVMGMGEAEEADIGQVTSSRSEVVDGIPITVKDVRFRYKPEGEWLIQAESLEAPQGTMVAVIGPHKGGKTTFMKLLAHVLEPQEGHVFVPTHLRVLHVSQDPIILQSGLWENLTFGHDDEDPMRVQTIMRRLKLEHLLPLLDAAHDDEDHTTNWWEQLSATDAALIHLARALIVNPEVLVVQRPMLQFSEESGYYIMDILAEFVEHRGIDLHGDSLRRRPRTCFYSSDFPLDTKSWTEQVWDVHDGHVRNFTGAGRRGDAHLNREFFRSVVRREAE